MELTEFIAARLDEDEAAALAWLPFGNPDAAQREHAARHDPARVLREIEGKRLIVKLHDREHDCPVIVPVGNPEAFAEGMYVSTEHVDGEDPDVSPCTTLRLLAAAWSDHSDWRQEWDLPPESVG